MQDYERYVGIAKISINEAIVIAEKYGINAAKSTMIDWCEKYKLGYQPGGLGCQWFVFEELFIEFISGKKVLEDRQKLTTKKRKKK